MGRGSVSPWGAGPPLAPLLRGIRGPAINASSLFPPSTPSFRKPHLTSPMATKYGGCDLRGFDYSKYALQNGPRCGPYVVHVLPSSTSGTRWFQCCIDGIRAAGTAISLHTCDNVSIFRTIRSLSRSQFLDLN